MKAFFKNVSINILHFNFYTIYKYFINNLLNKKNN